MDAAFESRLLESGVGEEVIRVLASQQIISLRVFRAMKEDHIVKLLQCSGMPVGGHALLWELWERESMQLHRASRESSGGPLHQASASPSPASSSSSLALSSPDDRKELFRKYQLKMKDMKGSKKQSISKCLKIRIGGMIYNDDLGKGVKKRFIPASQLISFPANSTYDEVIQKSREIFFPDEQNESDECFKLADSGGVPYDVPNKSEWVLSDFIQSLKIPPSKLHVYVLYQSLVQDDDTMDKKGTPQPPPLIHASSSTEQGNWVMKECINCSEMFRTYLPGVDTTMPDGSSIYYSDPQNECPACDVSNWGWRWNTDLFPEFAKK